MRKPSFRTELLQSLSKGFGHLLKLDHRLLRNDYCLFDQSNDKLFLSQIQKVRASLMAQMVKNLPVMQETWV